jgi:hypothetical protein
LLFTREIVSSRGTPCAVVVELPKLLRMSLLTIPLDVRMLLVEPLEVFDPSAGYGPFVSVGSSMHAVAELEDELLDELLLEDELEDELLVPLLSLEPPHAARNAAAPPEASQVNIWRRCRSCAPILSRSAARPGW